MNAHTPLTMPGGTAPMPERRWFIAQRLLHSTRPGDTSPTARVWLVWEVSGRGGGRVLVGGATFFPTLAGAHEYATRKSSPVSLRKVR